MAIIRVETQIAASPELCFDLKRSVELHLVTTGDSGERAVAGVTAGLIGAGQEVTWSARHFGFRQLLTSRMSRFERPHHFRDSQVRGAFARFDHDHYFEARAGGTLMTDVFDYSAPFGLLGRLAERLLLTRYMRRLLIARGRGLKAAAESGAGARLLTG
ncbi:MAG TPA: SRPBCC family protein [Polyangiaceae bacterium]|jgi:ligand-binding SRPBCC domain-containing protein